MDGKSESIAAKHKIKVVFLGDKAVGKSSIINRFVMDKFQEHNQATIGVDFVTKLCNYNSSRYKLELWDTAGQQKYRSLIKGYLRGSTACVFVYDMSNPSTYRNLIDWIKTYEQIDKQQKTFMLIFGNKSDLCLEKTQLEKVKREVKKIYPDVTRIPSLEGSAKLGLNITQIFEQLLQHMQEKGTQKQPATKQTNNLVKNWKNFDGQKGMRCCGQS